MVGRDVKEKDVRKKGGGCQFLTEKQGTFKLDIGKAFYC